MGLELGPTPASELNTQLARLSRGFSQCPSQGTDHGPYEEFAMRTLHERWISQQAYKLRPQNEWWLSHQLCRRTGLWARKGNLQEQGRTRALRGSRVTSRMTRTGNQGRTLENKPGLGVLLSEHAEARVF